LSITGEDQENLTHDHEDNETIFT